MSVGPRIAGSCLVDSLGANVLVSEIYQHVGPLGLVVSLPETAASAKHQGGPLSGTKAGQANHSHRGLLSG